MFRSTTVISIDSKGRLTMPTKYRDKLRTECDGQLICTIDLKDPCLLIYPLHEWEVIEQQLRRLSNMNPSERRVQRLLLGHATECDMDKNGRVLLSQELRNHIKLDKQAVLIGQLNKFELWTNETWQEQLNTDIELEKSGEFELTENLKDFSY